MSPRLQKHRKSFAHSYAFGVYPTLELLSVRPEHARKVLLRAPAEGHQGIGKILRLCRARDIPADVCPHAIRRISGRDFQAVGVFRKYPCPLEAGADHLVLHRPQYAGNIGTIIRTMVGFGITQLAVVGDAPDIMSPEVIRGSMGAAFRVHWSRFSNLGEYLEAFGDRRLYCFMTDGNHDLNQIVLRRPFSLVFGSEGAGLPEAARDIGTTVRIRHAGGIDSLNVGVAVGIVLHAAVRSLQGGTLQG
jgi:TrmH family RNA methyltransferase